MGTMKNRVMTLASCLLFVVLALGRTARADFTSPTLTTWDFSFYTIDATTGLPNGVATGAGSFQTLPEADSPYQESLEIVSTQGTFNDQPMGFVNEPYNAIDALALTDVGETFNNDQAQNYGFYFTAGGSQYFVY